MSNFEEQSPQERQQKALAFLYVLYEMGEADERKRIFVHELYQHLNLDKLTREQISAYLLDRNLIESSGTPIGVNIDEDGWMSFVSHPMVRLTPRGLQIVERYLESEEDSES